MLRGDTPKPTARHERPQRQPVVRTHPVTGKPALYLCESGQMDWIDGPFVGLEPGPNGEGARLLDELTAVGSVSAAAMGSLYTLMDSGAALALTSP